MYKAGDVVVNRRGDVVTLESYNHPEYTLFYKTEDNSAVYVTPNGNRWRCGEKSDYDIVGYAKITPIESHDANEIGLYNNDIKTPSYYHDLSPEPTPTFESWNLGWCITAAMKHLVRAGKKQYDNLSLKDSAIKDLRKAIEYLERKIEMIEKGGK